MQIQTTLVKRPAPQGATRFIGVDTEFDPLTRTLICVSFAERVRWGGNRGNYKVWVRSAGCERADLEAELLGYLEDPAVCLVGMSFALDAVVLSRFFGERVRAAITKAARAGRVSDVFTREWLWWVAHPGARFLWQCATPWTYVDPGSEERHGAGDTKRPKFSLAALVERWTGRRIESSKTGVDSVRLSFGRVANVPVEQWPRRFFDYAADDALDHLRVWEQQSAGQSRNKEVDNDRLAGLAQIFAKVRSVCPGEGVGGLLPGERKAVLDHLPMAWLCEPANGGLYVDASYCDKLIERYRSVAFAVEPLAGKLLRNVECRGQGELFPELLSSAALIVGAKKVKTVKARLRSAAHALFDRMPQRWAPPPTATGWRECGKFPARWCDWSDGVKPTLATFTLTERPGGSGVDHRRWASLSAKVISECLLETLGQASNDDMALTRALAWTLPTTNPGHALHQISTGKWTAETVAADGMSIVDPVSRKLWAWIVRETCIRTITNSLAPLANLVSDVAPGGVALLGSAMDGGRVKMPVTPTSANALITGRYSLDGAIRQNANKAGGVREALVPRPGWVVFLADYSQIELLGFAKAIEFAYMTQHKITGYVSSLSTVLLANKDAHIVLALDLMAHANPRLRDMLVDAARRYRAANEATGTGDQWILHDTAVRLRKLAKKWPADKPYDVDAQVGLLVDELRDQAKKLNYGLGGLMQPAKFVETQRKGGDYSWTVQTATEAWGIWRSRWHETSAFESWCHAIVKRGGDHGGVYLHPGCWRVRGGLSLTQTANTTFQTPIAEMFKSAMTRAWEETLDPVLASPMYGCQVVLPVHDEIVCVGPREQAPAALARLQEIMVEAGKAYLPGLPVGTSGGILERFAKAA
jgi:hypothetical protein